jgi:hypothetical protein
MLLWRFKPSPPRLIQRSSKIELKRNVVIIKSKVSFVRRSQKFTNSQVRYKPAVLANEKVSPNRFGIGSQYPIGTLVTQPTIIRNKDDALLTENGPMRSIPSI